MSETIHRVCTANFVAEVPNALGAITDMRTTKDHVICETESGVTFMVKLPPMPPPMPSPQYVEFISNGTIEWSEVEDPNDWSPNGGGAA